MQDNAIIELFFARDERGLSALSEKYGRLCAQIAYNILSNSEDADEAPYPRRIRSRFAAMYARRCATPRSTSLEA